MRLTDIGKFVVDAPRSSSLEFDAGALYVLNKLDAVPTVDAVPVVRCKDCKWLYDDMDDYFCRSHRGLVRICENSFCSYGERKDGDGNG